MLDINDSQQSILAHNRKLLLGDTALTTKDVLLVPAKGKIVSRELFRIDRHFLMNAPMDSVMDFDGWLNDGYSSSMITNLPRHLTPRLFDFKESHQRNEDIVALLSDNYISVGLHDLLPDKDSAIIRRYKKVGFRGVFGQCQFNIAVDVAHGYSDFAIARYKEIRKWAADIGMSVRIMSGSVATPEAIELLVDGYVDDLRIGIGSGSVCSTREVTGIGVPQLSAVASISNACLRYRGTTKYAWWRLIADGGIENSGDIIKYLAAGADICMLGKMYAACSDSPTKGQSHRGQASAAYQMEHNHRIRNNVPEGVCSLIVPSGKRRIELNTEILAAVRSAGSYLGFEQLSDFGLADNGFIRITQNGQIESGHLPAISY